MNLRLSIIFAAVLAAVLELAGGAEAQATCEGVTGNGRCASGNHLSFQIPITNTDASAFNDYATSEAIFGPNPGVCAATVGSTVKSLGSLGVPVTPLPNTIVSASLGPIGFASGKNFLAVRVVDLVGNRSGCSTEISFTFDNVPPAAPTNPTVGP